MDAFHPPCLGLELKSMRFINESDCVSRRSIILLIFYLASAYALARTSVIRHGVDIAIYFLVFCFGIKTSLNWLSYRPAKKVNGWIWGLILVLALELFRFCDVKGIAYHQGVLNEGFQYYGWSFLFIIGMLPFFTKVIRQASAIGLSFFLIQAFVWIPLVSPEPKIDVFYFLRDSIASLVQGINPYEVIYPNIYGNTPWYPNGVADAYPYAPMTLLFNLTALFWGDPRWGLILCHGFVAFFIFLTALRGSLRWLEAAVLGLMMLVIPQIRLIIEQAWVEPSLCLALSLFSYALVCKNKRVALWMGSFALALKQTMISMIPFIVPLFGRLSFKRLIILGSLPAISYFIFFIWSPSDFIYDVFLFHKETPFRPDGRTLYAAYHHLIHPIESVPGWSSLLMMVLAGALGWKYIRKNQTKFETFNPSVISFFWFAYATGYLGIMLLSKHAFTNYFYLHQFLLLQAIVWSRINDEKKWID